MQLSLFAQNDTLEVLDFRQSTCETIPYQYKLRERVISIEKYPSYTRIKLGVFENCSGVHQPVAFFHENTLELTYEQGNLVELNPDTLENGDVLMVSNILISECNCCFQFILDIENPKTDSFKIKVDGDFLELSEEKYYTYPIQYDLYKGDTVNYINRYGVQEGYFLVNSTDSTERFRIHNQDEVTYLDRKFYPDGNLKEELKFFDWDSMEVTSYYPNGKRESKCSTNLDKELFDCTYWNKKGREQKR